MSDDNNFSVVDVPESIADAIADTFNDLSTPARKDIGNFLGDISYCVFGKLHTHISKRRISDSLDVEFHEATERAKHDLNFKKYLSSISDVIESTPDDKLCEPRLDIVGPAIEASKYYIGNEDIRQMFVNLIGASINSDTTNDVHHSYVEIIKNLSPLDASNLKRLSQTTRRPICEYRIKLESGYRILQTNVWLFAENDFNISRNAVSLSNLSRLGLIKIDYLSHSPTIDYDKLFKEQSIYTYYSDCIESLNKGLAINEPPKILALLKDGKSIDIVKGIASLTPLGESFASICCS